MRISTTATAKIVDGKSHYIALISLVSNFTAEDFCNSKTKFNLKHNINSASTSAGNTYTIILKPFKGNSLEALLMQIVKENLVVKGVPIWSKEELKVLGSAIFKGSHEEHFVIAIDSLSNNPGTDLN